MSDSSANAAPPATGDRPQRCRGRGRAAFIFVLAVLAAGLTGAWVTKAFSHGFGPGGWHGPGIMGGPIDPVFAIDRADRMVRHLAIEIDATAEQQEKLRAIAKAAVNDLIPLREKAQSARERARQLLTQEKVDRAAIEAFRAEQIATADAVSKRLAQAIADAAEVLTPEQRRKLNDMVPPRRGFWHGPRRG
jgi:Spy/CpxP family protein refolding chaperone